MKANQISQLQSLSASRRQYAKGFTLIEFLVASSLAIIVIFAASGTYLMTRRMNNSAQARINIQQDLRNAATELTRDARMVGSFGCLSTGASGTTTLPGSPFTNDGVPNLDDNTNGYAGVYVIPASSFTPAANTNTATGDVLIMVYGKGIAGVTDPTNFSSASNTLTLANSSNDPNVTATINNKGYLVLSSCRSGYTFQVTGGSGNTVNFSNNSLSSMNSFTQGELSVSQFYASAYVVGTVNNISSLLRYDIGSDGNWRGPQIISQSVQNMALNFGYVSDCTTASIAATETFTFSTTPNQKKLPALIQMQLTYDTDATTGGTATSTYTVNATVRGGNTCANRNPSS